MAAPYARRALDGWACGAVLLRAGAAGGGRVNIPIGKLVRLADLENEFGRVIARTKTGKYRVKWPDRISTHPAHDLIVVHYALVNGRPML